MAEPQQCRSGVLGPGPLQAVLGPSSRGVVVGQAELCFPSGLLAESTSKWSPKALGRACGEGAYGGLDGRCIGTASTAGRPSLLPSMQNACARERGLSLASLMAVSVSARWVSCALGLRGDHEAGVQIPCFERLSTLLIKPTRRMAAGLCPSYQPIRGKHDHLR